MFKDPMGRFMRCGPGSATNPCELIRALLTDGRAVYRVMLPLQDPKYDQVVAYLNLPFSEAEKEEMASLDVQLRSGRGPPAGKNSKKQECRGRSPDNDGASGRKTVPIEYSRNAKAEPSAGETQQKFGPEIRNSRGEPDKFSSAPAGRTSQPSGIETLIGQAFGMVENPADGGRWKRQEREQGMRKALQEPDQWLVRRLIRHRAQHYDHYTDDEWEKIRDDLPRFAPGMMEAG